MPANMRRRLERAIRTRLATSPQQYGAPLRGSLRGQWKLRVGDYRVLFRIVGSEVWILRIGHRSSVYERLLGRFDWRSGGISERRSRYGRRRRRARRVRVSVSSGILRRP
ncbi:MAG: type II toxin-antitoxin system RelE family toxin [Candidatus Rokuibacteriota bacterium]